MECVFRLYRISLHIALSLILNAGGDRCKLGVMNASPASVVNFGSSITITCMLNYSCIKSYSRSCRILISRDNKEIFASGGIQPNSTAVSLRVENLTSGSTTFVCKVKCDASRHIRLVSGVDIKVSRPPDQPTELRCILYGDYRNIKCSWVKGRRTDIETHYVLWLQNKTHSFNISDIQKNDIFGSVIISASTHLESNYTAWVIASNELGTAVSSFVNFTLNDIVKPYSPQINKVEFYSSTNCTVYWEHQASTHLFELRFRQRNKSSNWSTVLEIVNAKKQDLYDLKPVTEYEFQIRCKFSSTKGLWSDWSSSVFDQTPEAVPVGVLDVWYRVQYKDPESRTILFLWKNLSTAEARGKILGYNITLQTQTPKMLQTLETSNTWYKMDIPKTACIFTVSAYNSKGNSPPAHINIVHHIIAGHSSPRNVTVVPASNGIIRVMWDYPEKPVKGFVVEWEELYNKDELNLKWMKLPPVKRFTEISENIRPDQCYKIKVYALFDKGTKQAASAKGFSKQKVPLAGPTVSYKLGQGKSVKISWNEIPPYQQRGCISAYRIYMRKQGHELQTYNIEDPVRREYIIQNLQPAVSYFVSMTAFTEAGEGPKGSGAEFYIPPEKLDWYIKSVIMVIVAAVSFACICFIQPARQRVLSLLTTFMPQLCIRTVPDPANCAWAKEYITVKVMLYTADF
nr:PREDICTED: interleukin-12 receptor subunit beta-2-like [Latimeria chalumnae]|eukprot:XP_005998713.2 PREDICTED: interleukin-12 receptor subunit beta-2-like [Latimeria chalumnae]